MILKSPILSSNSFAFIIAVDGNIRNSKLIETLEEAGLFENLEIIEADTPSNLSPAYISRQKIYSKLIFGREISEVEVAVKCSHEKAYRRALSLGCNEVFIFEDDAVIVNQKKFAKAVKSDAKSMSATITTYYSPVWSIWYRSKKGIKGLIPPAGAVAYKINIQAIKIALSDASYGVADWPTWSRKVHFNLVENSGIEHYDGNSYLDHEKDILNNSTKKLSLNDLRNLDSNQFLFRILYPFLWKFLVSLQVLLRRRAKGDKRSIII